MFSQSCGRIRPKLIIRFGGTVKEGRLTKPGQYALVHQKGNSWANNLLVIRVLANSLTFSRYGFSVSKRIGNAVCRNKVKRLLREILRQMPLAPGWDIVIIARKPAAETGFAELRKSVEGLLSRARLQIREDETSGIETN